MKRVLIIQDTDCLGNSINLLTLVASMYDAQRYHVSLLAWVKDVTEAKGYFDHIITAPASLYRSMHLAGMCDVVEQLHHEHPYNSIIISATRIGRMLAPRLARRLHTGLVADVHNVQQDGDQLMMIRTAYSGNIMAKIVSAGTGPMMMSVHPDSFSYSKKPNRETTIGSFDGSIHSVSTLRVLHREKKQISYDIRNSDILISGGGGVKRFFPLLHQLADALGGDVSASRKLVDQGIAPRSIQVGQSGKFVSPQLYIALGINGAIQHVEGLQDIQTIISVNTNTQAPICSLSDIVVEGNAKDFIEKLLTRIHNTPYTQKGDT
jgi:electron transfer flavoprotein alpha subunit